MSTTLEANTVIKTDRGEWVQVISQWDNMVTVEWVGGYEPRGQVHISHLLLNTAHKLSKKITKG